MSVTRPELPLTPEEPKPHSEHVRFLLSTILWFLINFFLNISVDDESKENLQIIDEQLKSESLVMYGYHSSVLDAVILPIFLKSHLRNLNTSIAPVAITHLHGLEKIAMQIMGNLTKTEFLGVVREQDKASYSPELRHELLTKLTNETQRHLSKPGNVYGAAPMGTRTHVLDSRKLNHGYARVAQKHQVGLVPVAFAKDKSKRKSIKVGKILPHPAENIDLKATADTHMKILAKMIEPELRGDYA